MIKTRQGNPCKRGHSGLRFVTSRGCVECARERNAGLYCGGVEGGTFVGKPCPNGHPGLRYVKGQKCVHCARARSAVQRCKNPIKIRDLNAIWRAANRLKLAADKAKYAAENRDKIRAWRHNAKARKRNAEGFYTDGDLRQIRIIQRDRCFYCPTVLNDAEHADHFTPLARRGTNWPENIVLACSPCNLSKGSKDPIQWAIERELSGIVAILSEGPIALPGRSQRI